MDFMDEAGVPSDDVKVGDLDSTGAARPPTGDGKAGAAVDSDTAANGASGATLNDARAADCGTLTVNTPGSGRRTTPPSPGSAVPVGAVGAAGGEPIDVDTAPVGCSSGTACKVMSACPAAGASVSGSIGATTRDSAGALGRTTTSTGHPGGGSGGPSMRPPWTRCELLLLVPH